VTDRAVDVFALPMNVSFRGVTRREGVLVSGAAGVGEFSPFWEYDVDESAAWLAAALEAADREYPEPVRDRVPVNCTVPAIDPGQAVAIVTGGHGCTTAKVKVAAPGQQLDDDVARVAAVRDAMAPAARIRVDANGAWTVSEAVHAIGVLAEFDLEYVEQPVATVEDLARVRRRVDVPVAADESIRRATDPLLVKQHDAADIAVLKVQPLGGVEACLRLAEQIRLPVVVSSAVESSVGIAAGVALAAALPELPYACGLATTAMFERDVVASPLTPVDGFLRVGRVPPDPQYLAAAAADPATEARWLDRLDACAARLGVASPTGRVPGRDAAPLQDHRP
jgi:O-succinylbenzoate synthase